jgi:hypothetical protein
VSALDFRAVHEAAHATAAHVTGAATVHSMSVNEHGGATAALFGLTVKLRPVLITMVAGHVGERLIIGTADPRQSFIDFEAAARCGLVIAANEELDSPHLSAAPNREALTAAVMRPTEADIKDGIQRITARRTARAEALVREAQEEARSLIASHLCVVRVLALALSRYQFLDELLVVALLAEGMERQHEDDRRIGEKRRGA